MPPSSQARSVIATAKTFDPSDAGEGIVQQVLVIVNARYGVCGKGPTTAGSPAPGRCLNFSCANAQEAISQMGAGAMKGVVMPSLEC